MKLDFQDRLYEKIDAIELPIPFYENVMDDCDSIALYSLPGGKTLTTDYIGNKYKELNYEIQGKSKSPETIQYAIMEISEFLESVEYDEIQSSNGSFGFDKFSISNEPFYSNQKDDGFFYFALTFQAYLDVYKEEN